LLTGHGTGMSSLGMQYVARFLNQPLPAYNVESGYGAILVEMGVFGLILWFVWVSVLLWQGWKIVLKLRETVYFPLGFAIWWYAVVDLVLLMYFGMQFYQNFVNNAYLWLLTGVLYRLPQLAQMPQPVPIPRHLRRVPRWRLALIGK
jgi:O-antigen ligase